MERKDRIQDQTTTTGTGTVTLMGVAPTGFRPFTGNITTLATVRYLIESVDSSEWEIGEGVFTDAGSDTLTRATVLSSSNAGSLVNFSAGTKTVSVIVSAEDLDKIVAEKINAATSKTTPVDADEIGLIDSAASFVLKKLTYLNLKNAITSWNNPIGTIREFNVSTNPASLLGIGTWSAFGTGRVTVSIDAGQVEFDTNGETGGAKTHLLTGAESGTSIHEHPGVNIGGISLQWIASKGGTTASGVGAGVGQEIKANAAAAANATSPHNNLQPYTVVYRWVRTA